MNVAIWLIACYALLAGLFVYVGYGAISILLPLSLWTWRPLLLPLTGYALVVLLFSVLNTSLLTGNQIVVVLFAAATGLNAWALFRRRHPGTNPSWKESAAIILISMGVYLIAVLPLLSYGTLTVIGTNADAEQYLGSAEYVKRFTALTSYMAESNPLLSLSAWVITDPRGNMGFSYILSLVSTLLGLSTLRAFAPTVAFFVSSNVVASYVFGRALLGLSWRAGVFSAAVLGLNSLVLWSGFFNYGRQVTALPLLPICAVAFAAFFEHTNWRSGVLAFLFVAAMVATYWPTTISLLLSIALFVVLATIGGVGIRRWLHLPVALVSTSLVLTLAVLPLAANAYTLSRVMFAQWQHTDRASIGELLDGLREGLLQDTGSLPDRFLSIGHLFGLAYYEWPKPVSATDRFGSDWGPAIAQAEAVLLFMVVCLVAYAIWHTVVARRYMAISLIAVAALQLGALRIVSENHYFFFKSLTFWAFLCASLLALGLARLSRLASRWNSLALRRLGQAAVGLIGVALLSISGTNAYSTVLHFWGKPQSSFVRPYLDVAEVNRLIPPDASICLSDDPSLEQGPMGVIAYALMPHPLFGNVHTAESVMWRGSVVDPAHQYFSMPSRHAGDERPICDYAVLAASEEPEEKGYDARDVIWRNSRIKVYRRGATVARLEFDRMQWGGAVTQWKPLDLVVHVPEGAQSPQLADGSEESLVFLFGSFIDQEVSIEINGEKRDLQVGPGLWRYQTEGLSIPATIRIVPNIDVILYVSWVHLSTAASPSASMTRLSDAIMLQSVASGTSDRPSVTVRWVDPQPQIVPGWLEMYVRDTAGGDDLVVGDWQVGVPGRELQVALDPSHGAIDVVQPGVASNATRWSPSSGSKGSYAVDMRLFFANMVQDVDHQKTLRLFDVTANDDGSLTGHSREYPLVYQRSVAGLWRPVDVTFGGEVALIGYTLEDKTLRPGGDARLSLYWRVPHRFGQDWRVFTHLTDLNGETWGLKDVGLQDSQRFTSGWNDSDIWRQDFRVPVSDRAPTGRYSIQIGLYWPLTLELLGASGAGLTYSDRVLTEWVKVAGADSSLSGQTFAPEHAVGTELGGVVKLIGYDLRPSASRAGGSLELTLYWQDLQVTARDFTVFAHLLDGRGAIRSSTDGQPLQGRYPTSAWTPGEVVADRHTISLADVAAGQYQIEVGLYAATSGSRLSVTDDPTRGYSRILLKPISVEP